MKNVLSSGLRIRLSTRYSALSTSYKLGLNTQTITNASPTISQPSAPFPSLKTVNANPRKELQNVLPKCNPFLFHLLYTAYRPTCICSPSPVTTGGRGWGLGVRSLTFTNAHNHHTVIGAILPLVVPYVSLYPTSYTGIHIRLSTKPVRFSAHFYSGGCLSIRRHGSPLPPPPPSMPSTILSPQTSLSWTGD